MKLELIIFLITVFVLANTYFEGKLLNKLKQYQKYYKMALFAFIGLCVYLFIKKNPSNYKEIVTHANSYIKYLPIDRNTSSFITPIIDLTSKSISSELHNNFNFSSSANIQQTQNLLNKIDDIFNNEKILMKDVLVKAKKELYLIDSAFACFANILDTSNVKHKYFFIVIFGYNNFSNKNRDLGYTVANDFLSDFIITPMFQTHEFKLP